MATKKEMPEKRNGGIPPTEPTAIEKTPRLNLGDIPIGEPAIPPFERKEATLNGKEFPLYIIKEGILFRGGIIAPIGEIAKTALLAGEKAFLIDCTEEIHLKPKWNSLASRFRSYMREEDARKGTSFFTPAMKCRGFKKNNRYFLLFQF